VQMLDLWCDLCHGYIVKLVRIGKILDFASLYRLFLDTLAFRISIGPTLIYFSNFSHAYALIQVPMLISFQEFDKNTWNLPTYE
jgi:hypothetical protein